MFKFCFGVRKRTKRLHIRRKAAAAAIHVNIVVSTARSISIEMMQNQHRARARLDFMTRLYKWLFDALPQIREIERDWPDYIYVPLTAVNDQLKNILSREEAILCLNYLSNDLDAFIGTLPTGLVLGTWRVTQGIYRFDETLYPQLINTQDAGKIPVDILCRLPEWCIYLETPGLVVPVVGGTEDPMHGAWVCVDVWEKDQMMLTIVADTDRVNYGDDANATAKNLLTIPSSQSVFLIPGATLEDSISVFGPSLPRLFANVSRDEAIRKILGWVNPIVNLLLYLCAGADYAGPAPQNPQPKKTKRGLRLFPPNKPTVWDVGVRMGSALRAAYAAQSEGDGGAGSGRQVRPHIRRAHWHGFRSGARLTPEGEPIPTEKRRFDLRWLPPIAVNIEDTNNDNMPSVIRLVK
jgi:hypothetical protein